MKHKNLILIILVYFSQAAISSHGEPVFSSPKYSRPAVGDIVPVSTSKKHYNRLIHEKSPYLLQHADNPIYWYPWGEEAFAAARKENKPIFLSIGYST